MDATEKKRNAAKAALEFIEPGVKLGVGTGSTVNCLIDLLPTVRDRIDCLVSSSKASTKLLEEQGFEVSTLNEVGNLDLYIDGADESNRALQLIKGGGAALTREKIVTAVTSEFICIADESKLVDTLGQFPLPVEVIPMARSHVARELVKLGGDPVYREGVVTDNGNVILDVYHFPIPQPLAMEERINNIIEIMEI